MSRRVVITGLGALSPIGNTVDEMWENACKGVCGIAPLQKDLGEVPISLAGELKNLNMEEYLSRRDIKYSSVFSCLARIAAKQAFADAGFTVSKPDENGKPSDSDSDPDSGIEPKEPEYNPDRTGVMISSSIGGGEFLESGITENKVGPFFIPGSSVHSASALVAMDLGAHGCNIVPVSACAGGANALGEAYLRIRYGLEDLMIAGGAETPLNGTTIRGFAAMRALYTGTDVNSASIPFDANRKGFVPAEGAGILVLEEYEHAKKRNAHIYAEVAGYGCTCDAYHQTAPEENGKYAAAAMKKALEDAALQPEDISCINAHGTGTKLNDLAECIAIHTVFGGEACNPYVWALKSMTGHMLSAGGAVEAVMSAKAVENDFIPPTVNIENQDENCGIRLVKGRGISEKISCIMSNSFGFGGFNVSLILKKVRQ